MSLTCTTLSRVLLAGAVVAIVTLGGASPSLAQSCLSEVALLDDFTGDPWATPNTRRSHGVETMLWSNTPYLFVNDGNGLRIWSLNDPASPVYKSRKKMACSGGCWAGLDGDNDWQLLQFSVCDECRYGFADFGIMGRAVFDLGTGTAPAIQTVHGFWSASSPYVGGMVFKHGDDEFVITQGITPACANGAATLMRINAADNLTTVQCLEKMSGLPVNIAGGLYLAGADAGYVYLGDNMSLIHIYRVTGSGATTQMTWLGANMNGIFGYGAGPSIDRAQKLMVTVVGNGTAAPNVKIYDLNQPSLPELLHSMQVTGDYYNRGEIQYPYLWVASQANLSSRTFNISVPTSPAALDQSFWDPSHSWNARVKTQDYDAEISADGTHLYLARFSITQQISLVGCGPAVAPTADLGISPSPAFPGDQITISNISTGVVDEAALWITDSQGVLVAGSETLTAGTTSLLFTIPGNVDFGESYTAHVTAQNADNQYNPALPGGQRKDVAVTLDRTPDAQVAVSVMPAP